MTNLFGINLNEKRADYSFDGDLFITKRITEAQEAEIEAFLKRAENAEKAAVLPLPLRIVQVLSFWSGILILFCTLSTLFHGISLQQQYQNAPYIDWIMGICFLLYGILKVLSVRRLKQYKQSGTNERLEGDSIDLLNQIREILGIPEEAVRIDVLAEQYTVKDGKIKQKPYAMTSHDNYVMFIWTEAGELCLATTSFVLRIPLHSLRQIEFINKKASFPDWNKEEPHDAPAYAQYRITTNQFESYFAKYYRVTICDTRGDFYLLIPVYDGQTFMELTHMHLPE